MSSTELSSCQDAQCSGCCLLPAALCGVVVVVVLYEGCCGTCWDAAKMLNAQVATFCDGLWYKNDAMALVCSWLSSSCTTDLLSFDG